jgi:hypothetical protein
MIYYRKDDRNIANIFSVPTEYSRLFRRTFKHEIANKEFTIASIPLMRSIFEGSCRVEYRMINSIQTVKMLEARLEGREHILPSNASGSAGANSWVVPDYLQTDVGIGDDNGAVTLDSLERNSNR